ncbi:unnamed protein product [Bemisia tabaci]|uniref:THAP-type domain-containing protein n=1 Tax=Bemisia tabaci TaxID=7038 RepID=A0A9N9ZWR3_BEMTA|nr:unnamed protein product [Bemisia tabaci]
MSPPSVYKYCFVPMCVSSTTKTPDKLFFSVPRKPELRAEWCVAVHRPPGLSCKSNCHCCEDHFNLAEDVQEYTRFLILKKNNMSSFRLSLKPGVVPHKFDCQSSWINGRRVSRRTAMKKLNLNDAPS